MSAEVRVSGRNVVNGAGEVIAKCTWERDAERIAAALNAQAGVVEALEMCRGFVDAYGQPETKERVRAAIDAARQARE